MKELDTTVNNVKKYFLKSLGFTNMLGQFMKESDMTVKSVKNHFLESFGFPNI